jgi:hypothetical protein
MLLIDVKFIVTDDSTDNTIAAVNSVVFDLILSRYFGFYRNAFVFDEATEIL